VLRSGLRDMSWTDAIDVMHQILPRREGPVAQFVRYLSRAHYRWMAKRPCISRPPSCGSSGDESLSRA
jgi:hypothetical protein